MKIASGFPTAGELVLSTDICTKEVHFMIIKIVPPIKFMSIFIIK